ncbi:hypothetical protein JHK84_040330 [Glycine max]|nr:hypothetical protein JHK84_040330 [Glycine max]
MCSILYNTNYLEEYSFKILLFYPFLLEIRMLVIQNKRVKMNLLKISSCTFLFC